MKTTRRTLLVRVRRLEDPQAWAEFSGIYRPLLARFARACGLSHSHASQFAEGRMAVVRSHVASDDYDASHQGFKRWLLDLAVREIDERLRAGGARLPPAGHEDTGISSATDQTTCFQLIWEEEHLRHCLDQLRAEVEFKTFEAFRSLVFEGWSLERVCDTHGLSPAYVRGMERRLRRRIQRLMGILLGD